MKQLEDSVDLFLEIKHENPELYQSPCTTSESKVSTLTNFQPTVTSNATPGFHLPPQLNHDLSKSTPNYEIRQFSNEHPPVMQAAIDGNLIHQQLNAEKFIDPRLLHEPSVSKVHSSSESILHNGTEKNKGVASQSGDPRPLCGPKTTARNKAVVSQFGEPRLRCSPNTDSSPPSFHFDGDSTFLMTPSPKEEEGNSMEGSERRQSGEVKELSQYMAGFLRLESLPLDSPAAEHIASFIRRDPLELAQPHPSFQLCNHSERLTDPSKEPQHQLDPSQDKPLQPHSKSVRKKPREPSQIMTGVVLPEIKPIGPESPCVQQSTRHEIVRSLRQERGFFQEESIDIRSLAQDHTEKITQKQKQRAIPKSSQELLLESQEMEQKTQELEQGQQELHPVMGPLRFMAELLQQKQDLQEQPKPEELLRVEKEVKETYVCRECGKCFRMRGSLVVHVRVAHTGRGTNTSPEPRNFHCSLCSKAFKKVRAFFLNTFKVCISVLVSFV